MEPAGRPLVHARRRPQYVEPFTLSGVRNGAAEVPTLKDGSPYPPVLTANQIHVRHASLLSARLTDLYAGSVYCPVLRRVLSGAEAGTRRTWHLRGLLGPAMVSPDGARLWPAALPAPRFNAKALSYLLYAIFDLYYARPLFDAGRRLTATETAGRLKWHVATLFDELSDEQNLAVFDDPRFPVGVVP